MSGLGLGDQQGRGIFKGKNGAFDFMVERIQKGPDQTGWKTRRFLDPFIEELVDRD